MFVHAVMHETIHLREAHERVALHLFLKGGCGFLGVVVSGVDDGVQRQLLAQSFQGLKHLLGITALEVAATAAEYEQGVAGDQFTADV